MDDDRIILEPRAALELLGKVTEGRSLVEAHAAAKTICVKKPTQEHAEAIDEIAALSWEQAAARFENHTDRHAAMVDAETMAADFLTQNPWLWQGKCLDPERLAEAIAEQMP